MASWVIMRQAENRYLAELRMLTNGLAQTIDQTKVIRAWLGTIGCPMDSFDKEAVEKALKSDFDFVLMDVQMPGIGGIERRCAR